MEDRGRGNGLSMSSSTSTTTDDWRRRPATDRVDGVGWSLELEWQFAGSRRAVSQAMTFCVVSDNKFTTYCISSSTSTPPLSENSNFIKVPAFLLVLFFDPLCNSLQLNIRCSFINTSNLTVPKEFLGQQILCKANTTEPFNRFAGSLLGHLACEEFGHTCLLHKLHSIFFHTACIVCHDFRRMDFSCNLSVLMLHSLCAREKCMSNANDGVSNDTILTVTNLKVG